jgi:hypothetical protein
VLLKNYAEARGGGGGARESAKALAFHDRFLKSPAVPITEARARPDHREPDYNQLASHELIARQ